MTRTLIGTPDPDPRVRPGFTIQGSTTTTAGSGWFQTSAITFAPYGPQYVDEVLAQMADESDPPPLKRVQADRLDKPREIEP